MIADSQPLAGKNALVTGGGSGIGLGIAQALAGASCRVAISGRRAQTLEAACRQWPGTPPLLCHTVDVVDRQSVDKLFRWADQHLGKIDILVNSAGINIKRRSMAEMEPHQWDLVMAANATGAYNCIYAVLPQMMARRDGLIVNISSISGKRASQLGGVAYSASKFALNALGICVGNEYAKHGIRVTNVHPGEVDTPILDHRPQPVTPEHRSTMLQPQDIGQLVLAIACLPPRAHVPEVIVKPLAQEYA
jgi:NAD(P)-dependent dehydrogenase (short-subunit alcohol dehydrogenase family)